MRSLLPKHSNISSFFVTFNPFRYQYFYHRGFTLVELLVVIVILAILGVVGVTIFSGIQSRARDAKRKADVTAISKAMEANYVAGTGYTTVVAGSWFADGVTPSNPSPGGAAYNTAAITTSTYTFCATLETSVGNATTNAGAGMGTAAASFFCKKNNQ